MAFKTAKLKPLRPIVYWFIWNDNLNKPLMGYFLGILQRTRQVNGKEVVDKAIAVYDDSQNKIYLAFLRGSLHTAPWQELLHKRVKITLRQKGGFELLYDDEDILEEMPEIELKGKAEQFSWILPSFSNEPESEPESETEAEDISEQNLPF